MKKFGYKNQLAVPRIEKIIVGIGLSRAIVEKNAQWKDYVKASIARLCGQIPHETKAKQSIAGLKVRKGMVNGLSCTLRHKRMYAFLERLTMVTLPRMRDFRGVSLKNMDKQGNLSIGIKEHIIFPEIPADEIDKVYGLRITIALKNCRSTEESRYLFEQLGFVFQKN
ncbi:MAG: 50S ribosomal protein L5 [Parcubacteria group bacterium]|nr:50S ribosomal protein L5 [Parcubacteria group bacterium]